MQCCFTKPSNIVFDKIILDVSKQINNLTIENIDNATEESWIVSLYNDYKIELINIDHNYTIDDIKEIKINTPNQWLNPYLNGQQYSQVRGLKAFCKVSYTGNPILFQIKPSITSIREFNIDQIYNPSGDAPGNFILSYEIPEQKNVVNKINQYFNNEIKHICEQVDRCNNDARTFNQRLQKVIVELLDQRIEQLEEYATIRKQLNLPPISKNNISTVKPIHLKKKQKISSGFKINKSLEEAHTLSDMDYQSITNIIEDCCTSMETAPNTFQKFTEEGLRDIIYSTLNTHYDNVTEESYHKSGKTDILISFDNHSVYIAECKIWKGKKGLLKAINQLFSYTTWRDTKVTIIIFNKTVKYFNNILTTIQMTLDELAITVQHNGNAKWICDIQNAKNEQIMHLTVQAFDLYQQVDEQESI